MITTKHYAALLGFGFVAVWIALGFGDAVLCLLAAGACYAIAAFMQGELDLGELQARLSGGSSASTTQTRTRAGRAR